MARFTLPRDVYYGKGTLEVLKTLKGKKAIVVVGGGSMKRFGFLDLSLIHICAKEIDNNGELSYVYVQIDRKMRESGIRKRQE